MESGVILSGSANIYYELYGSDNKKVLVLLHGNGENGRHFKKHVELLKDKYRILVIDSRGHGKSEFGRGQLSLGTMSVDLINVIEHLGFDKVNIAGFSDGANIAMLTAIKNSDIIDKLILIGGNYNIHGFKPMTALMLRIGYFCASLSAFVSPVNRFNKEYFSLMVKEPNIKKESLSVIKCPALVINGNKDMIKTSHAKAIAAAIPGAVLKIVEGDHFWIYRNPDEACRVIDEFLS